MNVIRSLITVLILTLVVLSALGIVWWGDPPEKLSGYADGGRVILTILIAAGLFGVWRLWAPVRSSRAG